MNECSFVKIVVVVLLEVLFLSPFARLQSLQSHTRSLSLSVFRFVMPAFIFTHYMRVSKCLHENHDVACMRAYERTHARTKHTDFRWFLFRFIFYGNELNIKMVDS